MEHDLPYFDDEVLTIHYRGAHGSAAAQSGFTCYGAVQRAPAEDMGAAQKVAMETLQTGLGWPGGRCDNDRQVSS